MTQVRTATREDEPELIRLLHMMHEEGGMLSLDLDCAREMFDRAFSRKGGIIGVIGERGNIRAQIYLLLTRFWYTKDTHLEELFNFVRPDARKSDCAQHLITFAKRSSDQLSSLAGFRIPLVIGVLTNRRMEAKVRLYRQSLGCPAGAFFVYGADASRWPDAANEDFWRTPFPSSWDKRKVARRNEATRCR